MSKCNVTLPAAFPVDCASELGAIILSGKVLERKYDAAKAGWAIVGYGIETFGPLNVPASGTLAQQEMPSEEEVIATLQSYQVNSSTNAILDKAKFVRLALWILKNVVPLVLAS